MSCSKITRDSLRSCSVTGAFFKIGLPSRLLLLATLSSSCFFEGVRGGTSANHHERTLWGRSLAPLTVARVFRFVAVIGVIIR